METTQELTHLSWQARIVRVAERIAYMMPLEAPEFMSEHYRGEGDDGQAAQTD